jgi:CheY-like chemotaxis protein
MINALISRKANYNPFWLPGEFFDGYGTSGIRPAPGTERTFMSSETMAGSESDKTPPSSTSLSQATSELNNLLQIISGTSSLIEDTLGGNLDPALEKYLKMLHTSIERAENVTAKLVEVAGGCSKKALMNSNVGAFVKTKAESTSVGATARILVVDDEAMILVLVKRILSDAGYSVVTAQSGFECLDLFRNQPYAYDLVLLDLNMPFLNGEETFGRLHEIRSDMPVIMCVGFMEEDRVEHLISTGLAGFLRKPIAPDEIVSHIRATLQSVKYSRAKADTGDVSAVV